MKAKPALKKNSPKEQAQDLFLKTKKIYKEFRLSRKESPLVLMNINNLTFLTLFSEIFSQGKSPDFIAAVIKEYRLLLKKELPEEVALVKTATALTEEEEELLSERLASVFGKYYRLDIEVVPELIGGLRVEIGDKVLDESVLGKIKELQQHLGL